MANGNAYPAVQLDARGQVVDSGVVVQFTNDQDQPGSGGGGAQNLTQVLTAGNDAGGLTIVGLPAVSAPNGSALGLAAGNGATGDDIGGNAVVNGGAAHGDGDGGVASFQGGMAPGTGTGGIAIILPGISSGGTNGQAGVGDSGGDFVMHSGPGAQTLGFYAAAAVTQPVVPMTTPDVQDVIDALVLLGLVAQHD